MPRRFSVFCSTAIKSTVLDLLPQFECMQNSLIDISFNPTSKILTDLTNGKVADAVVLSTEAINTLIDTEVLQHKRFDIASTCIGVAMKPGLLAPDIGHLQGFIEFLTHVPSLGYTSEGISGMYTAQLIERLGLTDKLVNKIKLVKGGFAAELITQGEVLYVIQNISELIPVPGIEIIGPLPDEVQLTTSFSGAIGNHKNMTESYALMGEQFFELLKSNGARTLFKSRGMTPL